MEWEYVPRYSTVFMEMDHSPKIVLWKKIEDSNTQRAIGVIAVSLDVRKLLGRTWTRTLPRTRCCSRTTARWR